MSKITIQQLACFDALASEGSFQAAADKLARAQPSLSASVKTLESQLGLELLDRSGYRVSLTEHGRAFHERSRRLLDELRALEEHARQLAAGEEAELNVVIGDICPLPETLALLRRFFDNCPGTRLNLIFEAITGPWERLLAGEADLILHHIDKADRRFVYVDLFEVSIVPVVAPGFLKFPITGAIDIKQMRDYVQCVIRDTSKGAPARSYFMLEGARSWSVSDQLMKKELILQGMGWGHMPRHLIETELADGRLIDISGSMLQGGRAELVAARLHGREPGPIARKLWEFLLDKDWER